VAYLLPEARGAFLQRGTRAHDVVVVHVAVRDAASRPRVPVVQPRQLHPPFDAPHQMLRALRLLRLHHRALLRLRRVQNT